MSSQSKIGEEFKNKTSRTLDVRIIDNYNNYYILLYIVYIYSIIYIYIIYHIYEIYRMLDFSLIIQLEMKVW